jgi:hypothetical protein
MNAEIKRKTRTEMRNTTYVDRATSLHGQSRVGATLEKRHRVIVFAQINAQQTADEAAADNAKRSIAEVNQHVASEEVWLIDAMEENEFFIDFDDLAFWRASGEPSLELNQEPEP